MPSSLLEKQDEEQAVKQTKEQVAVVTTEKGTFVIEFYPESAPVAVENFKKLINQKFYDGLTFHRIINAPGFEYCSGRMSEWRWNGWSRLEYC